MGNDAKRKKVSLIFFLLLLCTASCNTVDTPPDKTVLTLTLEDVSCTEAWITLISNNLQLPATINLLKDNNITKTINLQKADTLLYIDSLLPNQTYNFRAISQSANQSIRSNEIAAATLDTTSHNFTWQTFTFGGTAGSSTLYDVAIISENNIWCVGEILVADSSPNGYTMYNAVHWDGNEWNLKKITVDFRGFLITPALEGIFAFSPTQIWLAGGLTIFGDGTNWTPYDIRLITGIDGLSASKIWGSSPDNMYFVGRNGNIAHYNGSQWRKIESGTALGLADIHVNENGEIYACGGNLSTGQGIVLKINSNNTVTKIIDGYYYGSGFDSTKMFTENLYGPITSIWVNSNGTVYAVGNLIYRYNLSIWSYASGIESNDLNSGPFSGRGFSWGIRGKGNNDFIFVGERNTIRHFNGVSAIQLGESFSYTSEYRWYSVDYKQNTAVTAGKKGGYAAIMVFKK